MEKLDIIKELIDYFLMHNRKTLLIYIQAEMWAGRSPDNIEIDVITYLTKATQFCSWVYSRVLKRFTNEFPNE